MEWRWDGVKREMRWSEKRMERGEAEWEKEGKDGEQVRISMELYSPFSWILIWSRNFFSLTLENPEIKQSMRK